MNRNSHLYILSPGGSPQPSTIDEYNAWEGSLAEGEQAALGKRLRVDHVGDTTIATLFLASPVGWHNRLPQTFITVATGPGIWDERRYTSLRASLNGHRDELALRRKSQTKTV